VTFEYDKAGRLTSKTDQRAIVTEYTYDDRGLLLTKAVDTDGFNDRYEYEYDGLGRMTLAQRGTDTNPDAVSKSDLDYNALSHLESETQTLFEGTAREVSYRYDQAGNRTKMTHPAGDVELYYEYDALNQVTLVQRDVDSNGAKDLIDYDYDGLRLTRRRMTTTYKQDSGADCDVYVDLDIEYDEHRNISTNGNSSRTSTWGSGPGQLKDSWFSGPIADYWYTYDKVSNRLTQEADGRYKTSTTGPPLLRDLDYYYDGLHRLTKATYTSLGDDGLYEKFRYDLLGNRDGNGGAAGQYGYIDTRPDSDQNIPYGENNRANEYTLVNSSGVEYDAAGNLIADEGGYSMVYDADNQLELVYADSNGNEEYDQATENPVAAYAYDALGRRIMFRNHYDGSGIYGSDPTKVTTRYVYDGQNVIEEFNTNGTRQRYYVHGTSYIDERAVLHDDVDTDEDYYYLLKDLYTVVGLLNKQGHEVERYIYDAYGRVTMVSNPLFDVNFDGVSSIADGKIIQWQDR